MNTCTLFCVVDAPMPAVWARVTGFAGVNHELMPWLRMTPPRRYRDASIATVPIGVPLGKVIIWYFGFLPLDYDRMSIAEIVDGSSFHEVSTMATFRHWEHIRTLAPVDDGARTRVTDSIRFEPRIAATARVTGFIVRKLFAHRHRRLRRWFARLP